MRRWCENVDLVMGSMACSMTWAHQDSPLRATNRTAASRFGSASAARIRGSWKSSAAGSTTSSITLPSIRQVASSSVGVVLFGGCQTSICVEHCGLGGVVSEPNPRRWLMLPVVLMAMFMAGFDIWAVNVAAPSLQHDLHVSDAALQLIVGGYAFMYASGMVTGGRLGDLFGYRRMFMIGVVTFAAASLLCGLSQSSGELVAARLVHGLTGAAMVRRGLALISATSPPAERPRALSWFGVTMGLGFVSGQILGGGLLAANVFGLGWRAIFLVNGSVGAVALVAAARVVPHAYSQRRPKLDPLGALGISASLALALVPLTLGRDEGWPVWTWVALAAALPVLAATIAWERRLTRQGGEPLLNMSLFRDRAFSAGLLVNFASLFFFGSFMFVLTLLLQSGLGLSPLHAGIVNLPLALTFIAMTLLGPKVAARIGPRSITLGAGFAEIGR